MVGVLRLVAVVLDAEAGVAIVRSAVPKGVLSYRYKAARTLPCRRALPAFGRRDFWELLSWRRCKAQRRFITQSQNKNDALAESLSCAKRWQ